MFVVLPFFFNGDQLLKGRIKSKFFLIRVEPFLEGFHCAGKQTESDKFSPFVKEAEKYGSVTACSNTIFIWL